MTRFGTRIIVLSLLLSGLVFTKDAAAAGDYCAEYAKRAVEQYNLMVANPSCRFAPSLRWHNNFENHYNGCKIWPDALARHEDKVRVKLLQGCGAMPSDEQLATQAKLPADAGAAIAQMMSLTAGTIDPAQEPVGLVMCHAGECETGNSGTWIFQGAKGLAKWPKGQIAKLTILKFDANSLLIRREDTPTSNGAGFVAIYEGVRHGDRIDGKIHSAWPAHFPNGKPPGTMDFEFYATVPTTTCGDESTTSLDDAMEVGQTATRFRQTKSAFNCFQTAAKQGNAQAKGVVGIMYRDGIGTDANAGQAFHWAQLGAIQQDYNSELALAQMYEIGIGTAADTAQAQHWRDQAAHNPVVLQAQAQAQAQADMQKMAFMGIAALVEAMAKPDVYVVY